MRSNGTRGYHGYRGRRGGNRRWIIIALLVLILLAAAIFLLGQRYIVYDMDGSYHFEFPWSRGAEGEKPVEETGTEPQDLEIIIEERELPPLHAQELDPAVLSGGASEALAAVPEAVNAVAVRLKTADGDLLYPSALSEAIEAEAVVGGEEAARAIAELTGSGRYTIARLAALHDSRYSLAHVKEAAIQQIKYKNSIWFAPDESFYLAPEKEAARQYLCALSREVVSLGFDELLFDEFCYPTKGRLSNIDKSAREMTETEALSLLADNLRETVGESKVKLSVLMDEQTVLAGENTKSGQNLSQLAVRFDRIYVPTSEERVPELIAALEPYPAELIPILSAPPEDGVYLLAAS